MKTILRKETNVSLYLFEDSMPVLIDDEKVQVGLNPIEFFVSDCNINNCVLQESVPEISDWAGGKYLLNNNEWVLNPEWIDPDSISE